MYHICHRVIQHAQRAGFAIGHSSWGHCTHPFITISYIRKAKYGPKASEHSAVAWEQIWFTRTDLAKRSTYKQRKVWKLGSDGNNVCERLYITNRQSLERSVYDTQNTLHRSYLLKELITEVCGWGKHVISGSGASKASFQPSINWTNNVKKPVLEPRGKVCLQKHPQCVKLTIC